jgi:hypothetical protein
MTGSRSREAPHCHRPGRLYRLEHGAGIAGDDWGRRLSGDRLGHHSRRPVRSHASARSQRKTVPSPCAKGRRQKEGRRLSGATTTHYKPGDAS